MFWVVFHAVLGTLIILEAISIMFGFEPSLYSKITIYLVVGLFLIVRAIEEYERVQEDRDRE
ncbi:hypothetical protein [Oceanobacillus oncorhynchi]|uniref:hypothetical protein n=1 Tax=Oceanobacillus oncorhynchi TaxID=545501 RepID=UPI0018670E32|nr:hypothetical protein [Oceanobacillus oncorhynchi]